MYRLIIKQGPITLTQANVHNWQQNEMYSIAATWYFEQFLTSTFPFPILCGDFPILAEFIVWYVIKTLLNA